MVVMVVVRLMMQNVQCSKASCNEEVKHRTWRCEDGDRADAWLELGGVDRVFVYAWRRRGRGGSARAASATLLRRVHGRAAIRGGGKNT